MTPREHSDRLRACDTALKLAILIISIEQRRRPCAKLGFTQINYGRLFVRDPWTLFSIARELGCQVSDIIATPDQQRSSSDAPRWADLVQSAENILAVVTQQNDHVRAIIRHRAGGKSWTQVAVLLPGRVPFSLQDDYETAIVRFGDDDVAVILAHDDRRLGRTVQRRRVQKYLLSNEHVMC